MRYSNRKRIGFLAALTKSFKEFGCIDIVVAFVGVIVAAVVVAAVGDGIKAELKNRFWKFDANQQSPSSSFYPNTPKLKTALTLFFLLRPSSSISSYKKFSTKTFFSLGWMSYERRQQKSVIWSSKIVTDIVNWILIGLEKFSSALKED